MSNVKHYLKCDNCCYKIKLEEVQIENEIVTAQKDGEKIVAVKYYFLCPMCYHEYTCFYKDHITNELFRANKDEEAKERMIMLWEAFEDGC